MVCSAWLLVVGGQVQGSRLCVQEEGCCATAVAQHPSSWTHSLLPCTWSPTTSNQALHTIGGNKTHIVSSSWWWAYKCPKHVEHIVSAIKHSVASSWFFSSPYIFLKFMFVIFNVNDKPQYPSIQPRNISILLHRSRKVHYAQKEWHTR